MLVKTSDRWLVPLNTHSCVSQKSTPILFKDILKAFSVADSIPRYKGIQDNANVDLIRVSNTGNLLIFDIGTADFY